MKKHAEMMFSRATGALAVFLTASVWPCQAFAQDEREVPLVPARPYMRMQVVASPLGSTVHHQRPREIELKTASIGMEISLRELPELQMRPVMFAMRHPMRGMFPLPWAIWHKLGPISIPGAKKAILAAEDADRVSNRMSFGFLGEDGEESELKITVSRLAPAVLVESGLDSVCVLQTPFYIGDSTGQPMESEYVDADSFPDARWLLVWYAGRRKLQGSRHPMNLLTHQRYSSHYEKYFQEVDCPMLLIFDRPLWGASTESGGLRMSFDEPGARVLMVPLFGEDYPDVGATRDWSKGLPPAILERCGKLAALFGKFPVGVEETFRYDKAGDSVIVTERFEYVDLGGADVFAPAPPMLSLAERYGFPVVFSKAPVDTGVFTHIGPYRVVENASEYTWSVRGLGRYVFETRGFGDGEAPDDLADELVRETENMIKAGQLAPWICKYVSTPYSGSVGGCAVWSNPGDQLAHGLRILEALPEKEVSPFLGYLRTTRTALRPEEIYHLGPALGARRERYAVVLEEDAGKEINPELRASRGYLYGESRVPSRNLYALAEYYRLAGECPDLDLVEKAEAVLDANAAGAEWAGLGWFHGTAELSGMSSTEYWRGGVMAANSFFSGCLGYLRLARAVDRPADRAWGLLARCAALRFAMGKYARYLYDIGRIELPKAPDWSSGMGDDQTWAGRLFAPSWTSAGDDVRQVVSLDQFGLQLHELSLPYNNTYMVPFLHITPELGRFLADMLREECRAYVQRVEWNAPDWHIAYLEMFLGGDKQEFQFPSNAYQVFMARAWILGEAPALLARYLDVPWTARGDLYYLDRLAETIQAYRGVSWERLP